MPKISEGAEIYQSGKMKQHRKVWSLTKDDENEIIHAFTTLKNNSVPELCKVLNYTKNEIHRVINGYLKTKTK